MVIILFNCVMFVIVVGVIIRHEYRSRSANVKKSNDGKSSTELKVCPKKQSTQIEGMNHVEMVKMDFGDEDM